MHPRRVTEQYLDRLILIGGTVQSNMPASRRMVYFDAQQAENVIAFNRIRAKQ
jgi:hypothetical protein